MSDYTITPYRYRKGSVVVACNSPDIWNTRADRLARTFGRYVHRAGGYVMSPGRAKEFAELYAAGWDGDVFTGERIAPRKETQL